MKIMDIEKLLQWAYRDELPKAQAKRSLRVAPACLVACGDPVWRRAKQVGDLGTLVDEGLDNRFGVVSDRFACEEPHDDAIAVAAALIAYRGQGVSLPEDWNPLEDFDLAPDDRLDAITRGLRRLMRVDASETATAAADTALHEGRPDALRFWSPSDRLRIDPVVLVIQHALLRSVPDWEAGPPVKRPVVSSNGRPRWFRIETRYAEGDVVFARIEVDGLNATTRRPYVDAYQKLEWVDDPALIVEQRALYEIWHAMLGFLVADLDGMIGHVALPSARAARPWINGGAPQALIWPDLAPAPVMMEREMPRAGPRAAGRRAGPMRRVPVDN